MEVLVCVIGLGLVLMVVTCTSSSSAQDTECVSGFIWRPVMGYTGETCDINTRG